MIGGGYWAEMSWENVEVVKTAWDAWLRDDVDALVETYHSDIVWDATHFDGWPEKPTYRGQDEVRPFLEEWRGGWDSYEAGVHEMVDSGDQVLVYCWQRMVGPGSGVPVELEVTQVSTVRDGKIARIDVYTDRSEAFEAVGLRP